VSLPVFVEIERTAELAVLQLTLDSALDIFQGHFPDVPILPGVAQIDWAMRLAERYFGVMPVAQDFQIKFTDMIRPGMTLVLTLALDTDRRQLTFHYKVDGKPMSSGRVKLEAAS